MATRSKRRKSKDNTMAQVTSDQSQEFNSDAVSTSIGGDKITVGSISGRGAVAIGRGAQATMQQGLSGGNLATLFKNVYQQIDARPEDPNVEKAELTETVQKIEAEVAKGEQANSTKVERWLRNLAAMAPDILDVTIACLTSPLAGVANALRKIAAKAKEETGKVS